MLQIVVLAMAAFVTATISGTIGMGGGILLLATMFCFLPHGQAIPLHAAVQIVSNGTRVLALWKHVDWSTVARFAIGAVPGGVAGAAILWSLGAPQQSEPYLKVLIGVYVLTTTFIPIPRGGPRPGHRFDFTFMGLLAGTAAVTVGAVGPLIAPLFARRAFVKEHLVATKAVCQMLLHVVKIPTFAALGTIEYGSFSVLIVVMTAMSIPGTLLGKRILARVSPAAFVMLFRIALTVAGLKVLIFDGVMKIAWFDWLP
ncbi:MAG: sulfite exporter TauE/SafE family protein [Planctomycetota bacterium]|nr:sulfite exporter TauE/SafE family protein [Planctomycetota bacterium]